jgi:hypothetical protein
MQCWWQCGRLLGVFNHKAPIMLALDGLIVYRCKNSDREVGIENGGKS